MPSDRAWLAAALEGPFTEDTHFIYRESKLHAKLTEHRVRPRSDHRLADICGRIGRHLHAIIRELRRPSRAAHNEARAGETVRPQRSYTIDAVDGSSTGT